MRREPVEGADEAIGRWLTTPQPIWRLALLRIALPLVILGFLSSRLVARRRLAIGTRASTMPDLGGNDWRQPLYLAAASAVGRVDRRRGDGRLGARCSLPAVARAPPAPLFARRSGVRRARRSARGVHRLQARSGAGARARLRPRGRALRRRRLAAPRRDPDAPLADDGTRAARCASSSSSSSSCTRARASPSCAATGSTPTSCGRTCTTTIRRRSLICSCARCRRRRGACCSG